MTSSSTSLTFANRRAWSFVLVGVGLSLGYFFLRDSTWRGSTELHTVMEVIATLLALVVGATALVSYYTGRSSLMLLIGTGFLGTGLLDGYHAVVTSAWFLDAFPSPTSSLSPWSWNASRCFLAMAMLLSWCVWKRESRDGSAAALSDKAVFASGGILTLICFGSFAFMPLPEAYQPETFFGRPEEFVSAVMFLAAGLGYLSKGRWKSDGFEYWLVMSLVVSFVGQVMFMSTSHHLFDAMFDVAHLLKKLSYVCVLTGLYVSMFHLFRQAEAATAKVLQTSEFLAMENTQRRKAERLLRESADALEKRVKIRTQELEASRVAALNMMEDAIEARRESSSAQEKLLGSERLAALGTVSAGVAHELNNPLMGIMNQIEYSIDRTDDERMRQVLSEALTHTQRCVNIVRDLLVYSRSDEPSTNIKQECKVNSAVEEATQSCRQAIQTAKVDVEVMLGEDDPAATISRRNLCQVLINLITNACHALESADEPELSIGVERLGGNVVTSVQDNGSGIPKDVLPRLFEPFFTTKPPGSGTGLGLGICKSMIERSGGTIKVVTEPGIGTTFRISVPAPVADECDERHRDIRPAHEPVTNGKAASTA